MAAHLFIQQRLSQPSGSSRMALSPAPLFITFHNVSAIFFSEYNYQQSCLSPENSHIK
ncbi:hypothetical protein [Sodalis sp. (in: enterobacteria)]|uniref:hypothetical protein n=1 Tax=Sodalis sp. (in: enterobacteria) TaxID=1898979 RepID=UPI003F2CB7E6